MKSFLEGSLVLKDIEDPDNSFLFLMRTPLQLYPMSQPGRFYIHVNKDLRNIDML